MSFTSLEADGPNAGQTVSVSTIDNSPLLSHVGPDHIVRIAPGLIGKDGTGPYFDPAGALGGEQAVLGYDAYGLFVESATDPPVRGLMLRRPDVPFRLAQTRTPAAVARSLSRARALRAKGRRAVTTISAADCNRDAVPVTLPVDDLARAARADARSDVATATVDSESQAVRAQARTRNR